MLLRTAALVASLSRLSDALCPDGADAPLAAITPEAAFFDESSGEIYVGQVFGTSITTVKAEAANDLPTTEGPGTVGLYVRSGKVYSAWNDSPVLFTGQVADSKVLVHNLADKNVTKIDLKTLAGETGQVFLNDVYAAADGRIFATGSSSKALYEISADYSTVKTHKPSGDEWQGGVYNGLELGPNGVEGMMVDGVLHVFVGLSLQQKMLYKVNTQTGDISEVVLSKMPVETFFGIDGLRFDSEGNLHSVVSFNDNTTAQVWKFVSNDKWATAEFSDRFTDNKFASANFFTTLTRGPDNSMHVVNTNFNGVGPYYLTEVCYPEPPPTPPPTPLAGRAATNSVGMFTLAAGVAATFAAYLA